MIEIEPVTKRYAWGSQDRLQRLFRLPAQGGPLAEMWFSGHAGSPSALRPDGSAKSGSPALPLDEAIRRDPERMVGATSSRLFGPVLPYLFKVISARIPLSLQVHPVGFEARAGYHREQAAGIPADAPERSFRDMLAKHEMVVALEPFEAAVGFMPPQMAARALAPLRGVALADRMLAALAGMLGPDAAVADTLMPDAAIAWPESGKRLFRAFYAAIGARPEEIGDLPAALRRARADMERDASPGRSGDLGEGDAMQPVRALANACAAADAFPGDPSVLALLLMNPVRLEEGDAVFIPAGQPHVYLHGTAAEIMTNSDNVLRAGMTVKHRDVTNLLHSLDCRPSAPIDPRSSRFGAIASPGLVTYRPNLGEYMLAYGHVGPDGEESWPMVRRFMARHAGMVPQLDLPRLTLPRLAMPNLGLPQRGPRVLLCCAGRVRCSDATGTRVLEQGRAVFVPAGDGRLRIGADAGPDGDVNGTYLFASTPF